MLRRLFRGRDRLADADPNVRRETVLALDAARARAQAGQLARLLADDPDRRVRLAVVERLDSIDVLMRVLDDGSIGEAAARRIVSLAQAGGGDLPDHPRLRELNLLHASAEQQQARIAGMNDPEQLIALALKDRGSLRSAVLAHPVLQNAAALGLLEKRSRGADKSLNRHAREALDGIRRLQHQATEASQRVAELVAALGRTVPVDDQAAWDRQQQLYDRCAAALATYDQARSELTRWGEALPSLDELRSRIAPPAPRPAAAPPGPAGEAEPTIEATLELTPEARAESGGTVDTIDTIDRTDIGEAGHTGARADTAETGAPVETSPSSSPSTTPEADAEHAAAAATERAARQAAAAARQAEFAAVERLLEAGEQALAAGQVGAARQTLTEARQRLDAISGEMPRDLARRLNRIGAAIAELRDWQTFVTAPKRDALCEALQALVDHPLAPPDQADRLKALRAEWRELGPITRKADAQLADRFNALAEQAFEPCREYFAQQAEIRRANLAERTRICDQLAQYLSETDWQRADMKAAEQILRTAREAWRQYLPVDRGAGKAVEARFETLQDELYGRLKAFWTGNGEAKRGIVEEAEALAIEDGDLDGRINRAKGLQQRWRGIGPTMPRAQDQALWNAFRSACDALFSARDTARTAADSELRQIAGQCAAALDDFEHELAALTPETATEAQARGLRERVRELDSLPPPLRQPLAARRSDLVARHQTLLREQGRVARRNRLGELQAQDAAFSQTEIAHRDGGAAPEAPARCFDGRLGRHDDPVPYDALRRLTLHAEQAAGIAAPAADESLRLEIQVERLRAGLGGSADETPLALAERWCAMGPKDASVDPLRTRFFAALAARQDA